MYKVINFLLISLILALFMLSPSLLKAKTFMGYQCTDDCSGHEAGYNWARDNEIDDTDDCDGKSESFNEGCVAYVEENEESQVGFY
jgi:hypothetical protein